jgi:hypothetical protein
VKREGPGGIESRRDHGPAFERAILSSAPEGVLPAPFLAIDSEAERE